MWKIDFDRTTTTRGNERIVNIDFSFFVQDNPDTTLFQTLEANNGRDDILTSDPHAGCRACYPGQRHVDSLDQAGLAIAFNFR